MAKLITLVVLVVGLISVLSFNKYQELPVKNEKFDYEAEKKSYEQHLLTLEELEKAKHHVEKVEEEEEPKELVVLDTPELVTGHKLYGKCIACHGKAGEGKKSQKAPRIGGQLAWYIEKSLGKMQSKERINKVMDPYIKNLSEDDFKALAAYISKLPWAK